MASAESYDRFYDIGWEAFQRGVLPLVRLEAGRLLYRYSSATIEQSRTLRAAQFSTNSRDVRYSGVRLSGREGQGALYMASLGGVVRERVHYAGGGPAAGLILPGATDHTRAAVKALAAGPPAALPGGPQPFHVYRLQTELLLADIRVTALVRVFQDLFGAPGARARFGLSAAASAEGLMNAVLAPLDYSAARGIADAVYDVGTKRGIAGLLATSARGDSDSGMILDNQGDGVEGLVYALFGRAEQRLDSLQPLASFGSFTQMRDAAKRMPGFSWVA
jgi:hypothetical protein